MTRARLVFGLAIALACLCAGTPVSHAADDAGREPLSLEHQQFLEDVELLITKEERKVFLGLAKSYQRETFIRRFWEARDPYPETERNERRDEWYARLAKARADYESMKLDQAKILMLYGEPAEIRETQCLLMLWPLQSWYYPNHPDLPVRYHFVFYQRFGGGPYRLWYPDDGFQILVAIRKHLTDVDPQDFDEFYRVLSTRCPVDNRFVFQILETARLHSRITDAETTLAPPVPRDTEWLDTFRGFSTDLPQTAQADRLSFELELGFPARHLSQTLVQGIVTVPVPTPRTETTTTDTPADAAGAAADDELDSYGYLLNGEVLREDALHESFRYRFDIPVAELEGDTVPLVFERHLRPGAYRLVLRLEELHGPRVGRREWPLEVPRVEVAERDPEVDAALEQAETALAAATAQGPSIALRFAEQDVYSGSLRVDAETKGDGIRKVRFLLDGKTMLTKTRPPYSVELPLGEVPRDFKVEALALGDGGAVVARDETVLNAARQRFAVRLLEPRQGERYEGEVDVVAEVDVPDGATLDRLELYLDERRTATLYQPPFRQRLTLPAAQPAQFVRAVAYLESGTGSDAQGDGPSTEALALFNAPDYVDTLDVQLTELYVSVLDGARPVLDLAATDFRVVDGGEAQTLMRFERVADLPVQVALMIDTSASMVERLPHAQRAAARFLGALTARDRAAVITFSESPSLAVKLTDDREVLRRALTGLHAERGTALYDSLVYTLQYMKGLTGQRAILLLTDGGDRSSRFDFEQTLVAARRSGITVYTVGLDVGKLELGARANLKKLAEETGGDSYFVADAKELDAVYDRIQERLRSRYLLAYQPNRPLAAGEFRPVEVTVQRHGLEVETVAGYYR